MELLIMHFIAYHHTGVWLNKKLQTYFMIIKILDFSL